MDYAEARAAFFQPREGVEPVVETMPGRRLRNALEPIATVHYWSEPASEAYVARGLDFLTGYVWSRGCVLGEPDGAVVSAAFGVFEPGLIVSTYDAARAACSLADVRAARESGAVTALGEALGDVDAVGSVVAALRRGIEAADPTGRALFAGSAALPWPADELGGLWHAATTLREFRGDCHLAACVAVGLTGLEANLLTEIQVGWEPGSYAATRGWSPEAMDQATAALRDRGLVEAGGGFTDEGRRLRDGIEDATESLQAPVLDSIGADLADVVARSEEWGDRIIERGWFPPDPFKRASG